MDQIKRFFKEAATYTGFDFLRRLLGFFLIPVYTRALTPAEYGTYFIVNLVIGFLAIVYNLGFMTSLYRYQPKKDGTFFNGLIFLIPFTTVISVFFLAMAPDLSSFFLHDAKLAYLFQIGIIFLFFENILGQVLALKKIEHQPYQFGFLSLSRFASGLFLNILFVVVLRRGVAGIFMGNAIAAIAIALLGFYWVRSKVTDRFDKELFMKQLNYGLPLLPAIAAFFLIDFIDRFMLERLTNLAQVGIYSLAYQFGTVMNLIILGFRMAYAPFFFSLPKEKFSDLSKVFYYFVLGIGFLYTGLILILPEVFSIFVGGKFHQASNLVWIIALGFFAYGIYINFASHLYLRDQTGLVSLLTGSALLINIAGNLALIPKFGIYGAAWATLLSYGILAVLTYRVTKPEDYRFDVLLKVLVYILAVSLINLHHPTLWLRIAMILGYIILLFI